MSVIHTPRPNRRLGCSTITFRMVDLPTALDRIAANGFKTIDLGSIAKFCPHVDPSTMTADDHHRMADLIASRGLSVSAINAWSLTALNRPEGPDVEIAWVKGALRLAAVLGCYAVSMQPGRRVAPEDWPSHARFVTVVINELGVYATDLGVQLLVEAPHMGTLAETFDLAQRFIDLLHPDLIGVALDTSHIHNGGSSLAQAVALESYIQQVRHVHVRDYKDGSIQVTPGDGEIKFGPFFAAMADRGYSGDYNLELEKRDATADDMQTELDRALRHLRPLFD